MKNDEFPDALYRIFIIVTAKGPECRVTKIRARSTLGGYVTENKRRIRRQQLGEIDIVTRDTSPTCFTYTDEEKNVDRYVELLTSRIQGIIKRQAERFNEMHDRAQLQLVITREEYAP